MSPEPCIVCGSEAPFSHKPWCSIKEEELRDVYALSLAKTTGNKIIKLIHPFIRRWMFVGSVGRDESAVGDIDILVEPRANTVSDSRYPHKASIEAIRKELNEMGVWNRGGERMMVVDNVMGTGIKLDLFLCHPPAQWGVLVGDRLNPAPLVIWAKNKLDSEGYVRANATIHDKNGHTVYVEDEQAWFKLLGLDYVEPHERYQLMKKLGIENRV